MSIEFSWHFLLYKTLAFRVFQFQIGLLNVNLLTGWNVQVETKSNFESMNIFI